MHNIKERIIKVTADKLAIKAKDIQEDSSFIGDLGADSLDLVELIMGFEEEFGVEISDEISERVNTIKDAMDVVAEVQAA